MTAIRAAFKAYRMHQVLIMPRFARLTIALGLATAVFPVDAEYYFNPRFLSNDFPRFMSGVNHLFCFIRR